MIDLLAWALILYIIVSLFIARAVANDGGDLTAMLYVGFGWPVIIVIAIQRVASDYYTERR